MNDKEEEEEEEEVPRLIPIGLINRRVPVTILSGYLGSGKTTLLNYILHQQKQMKIAVILNDFGNGGNMEINLAWKSNEALYEEWIDLPNGCLCCSIKHNGIQAIETLMQRKGSFDYILLETSGLADPAPIAQIFWMDKQLESQLYLDGIITIIDGKNGIHKTLPQQQLLSNRQIALADYIILNKTDLISSNELTKLKQEISSINPSCPIQETQYCQIPLNQILDLKAYDQINSNVKHEINNLDLMDQTIGTIFLEINQILHQEIIEKFLQEILWKDSKDDIGNIWRIKGILAMEKNQVVNLMWMVQGVEEIFEVTQLQIKSNQFNQTGLILIGQNLQPIKIKQILNQIIHPPQQHSN